MLSREKEEIKGSINNKVESAKEEIQGSVDNIKGFIFGK
jgi:uncharacterized protein YjbJ (UPF0337 family)